MPKDEFIKWLSYLMNKPPSVQEQQMAVLSTLVSNALGGKAKVKDFLVSKIPEKERKTMSPEAMRGLLGVASKKS